MRVLSVKSEKYPPRLHEVLFGDFAKKSDALAFCKIAQEELFSDSFVRVMKTPTKKKVEKKSVVKKQTRAKDTLSKALAFYKQEKYLKFSCPGTFKNHHQNQGYHRR